MEARVLTRGDERALALAGLDGTGDGSGLTVCLGTADGADVTWWERTTNGVPGAGARVIAPGGRGLWRRAPWPARDDLFDLPPPAERRILLVGEADRRAEVVEHLTQFADAVTLADVLKRADLEAAAVVVFAGPAAEPLPAAAPAVLAAGRLLVVRAPAISFGLIPGIDFLCARTPAGVAELAGSAVLQWDSFRAVRAFGRIAAEAHRASVVYERIASDVAAGR